MPRISGGDKLEGGTTRLYRSSMQFLDVESIRAARLETDPFPYCVVPGCIPPAVRATLSADFPAIDKVGSFPVASLRYGPGFAAFVKELESDAFREVIAGKLGIDLQGRPTMITVRGQAGARDGNIHADSKSKLVTVLIYMNEVWEAPGGRLRLLRSSGSLDDMVAEVPPDAGTLLVFPVTPHSWHGHAPAFGPRRVVQLNWVTDEGVVRREQARHGFSAKVKRLFAFGN